MSNNQKILFRFKADKTIKEKQEVKDRNAAGEEITVVKEVDKTIPHEFALLSPTRALRREAEVFYNKQLANALRQGMILQANLASKLSDDGNIFSKEEIKRFDELKSKFLETSEKLKAIMSVKSEERTEEQKAEFTKLSKDHYDFLSELNKFENVRESVFSGTAERYAMGQLLEFYTLNLSCRINDKGMPELIFPQLKYEDKLAEYDKILDSDDNEFMRKIFRDLSFVTTYWSLGTGDTEEDFNFALKKAREND